MIIHESKIDFNCGNSFTDIYIIIKDKSSNVDDLVESVGLDCNYNVRSYFITKDFQLPFKVETLIGNMCKLGVGDSAYSIQLNWISSLARFFDITDSEDKAK